MQGGEGTEEQCCWGWWPVPGRDGVRHRARAGGRKTGMDAKAVSEAEFAPYCLFFIFSHLPFVVIFHFHSYFSYDKSLGALEKSFYDLIGSGASIKLEFCYCPLSARGGGRRTPFERSYLIYVLWTHSMITKNRQGIKYWLKKSCWHKQSLLTVLNRLRLWAVQSNVPKVTAYHWLSPILICTHLPFKIRSPIT